MEVVEKKPVPVYQVDCHECKSKIQYTAAEVHTGYIHCPVCKVSLWADTIRPVGYKTNEEVKEDAGMIPRWKTVITDSDFENLYNKFEEYCEHAKCSDCSYYKPGQIFGYRQERCYYRYLTEMIVKED